MGRNRRLAKNVSFVMIGNIGAKLIGFILLPFYTRWLSSADYGITDIIGVYAALLANVGALNIAAAIFVFPSEGTQDEVKTYFSSGLALQAFCAVALIPVFLCISFLPFENTFIKYSWYIYGTLVSTLFQTYTQSFCRGLGKMKVFSFTGIVNSVTLFAFSFLFIPCYGVTGYVLATIMSNVVTGVFTYLYSGSYHYLSMKSVKCLPLREMLAYCIPLIPTGLMWWLVGSLNRPLLEQYCGLMSIGLLAVGNKLPSIMNMAFGFFQQAWMVTVMEEYRKENFAAYYCKIFRLIFLIQMSVCLLVIFAAKPFIHIMTMPDYYEAWKFIPLVTLGTLFSNITAFAGALFTAHRNSKFIFITSIAGGVVSLTANFLFIPVWGVYGACIAIILAHLSSCVMRVIKTNVYIHFRETGYILSQVVIALFAYGVSFLPLLWCIIGYVFSSILLIWTNRSTFSFAIIFVKTKHKNRKR